MVLQRRNMIMAIKFARKLITVSGAALGAYVFFVRPWQRRWGTTDEEVQRTLPGDELIAHPDVKLTRAVTVRAKPADIWPWLMQIGQGRGGYYSYDWLENLAGLKMKSTVGINPAWQQLKVGDIIPAEPVGLRSRSNRQRAYAPGLSFLRPERAVSVGQTGEQTDRLHLRTDRVLDDTQDAARHQTASGAGQSPRNRTGQNRGEATKEWDRYQSRTSVVQKASNGWLYRGRGLYS